MVILYRNEKSGILIAKDQTKKDANEKAEEGKRNFHRKKRNDFLPHRNKAILKYPAPKENLIPSKANFRKRKYWDDRSKR